MDYHILWVMHYVAQKRLPKILEKDKVTLHLLLAIVVKTLSITNKAIGQFCIGYSLNKYSLVWGWDFQGLFRNTND